MKTIIVDHVLPILFSVVICYLGIKHFSQVAPNLLALFVGSTIGNLLFIYLIRPHLS